MRTMYAMLFCCLLSHSLFSADGKICGYLYNKVTREPVPDANVMLEGTGYGSVSRDGGFFVISPLPEGEYRLRVRVLGYQEETRTVNVAGTVTMQVGLTPILIEIDPVIVTATLTDHRASQVSVASQVYGPMRLQRQVGLTVGETIASAPGLYIKSYDGLAGPSMPSIRGANVDQMVVLMDGVRLNTAQGGGVDLNLLPISAIDRIEIIRGGHSTLLGSDAMGGAIHLRSKNFSGPKNYSLGLATSIGSFGTSGYQLQAGQKWGRVLSSIHYHHLQSDGNFAYVDPVTAVKTFRQNNDYAAGSLFVKSNVDLGDHHQVQVIYHRLDADKGNAGSVLINPWSGTSMLTPHARAEALRQVAAVQSENQISDKLRLESQMFLNQYEYHYTDPDGWQPTDDRHENTILGVNIQSQVQMNDHWRSTVGGEARQEKLQSTKFTADDRLLLGLYWQNEMYSSIRVGGRTLMANLIPALRWDRYSDVGSRLSPKLGWLVSTGQQSRWSVRGNVGSSYRVPTFDDLYWPDEVWVKGNPQLKPETSMNYDVGISWEWHNSSLLRFEMNYFANEIENLISWNSEDQFVWMPMNIGKARITGFEAGGGFHLPKDRLYLEMFHTWMDATDQTIATGNKNKKLPYRPQNKFDLQLGTTFHSLFAQLHYGWVDKRFITAENSASLPSYELLDGSLGGSLPVSQITLEAKLQVLNILDKKIFLYEGYPLPGRSVRLTVGLQY